MFYQTNTPMQAPSAAYTTKVEKYEGMATEGFKDLRRMAKSGGWEDLGTEQGIKMFRKESDTGVYILRGDTIIEAPPIEVLKVLCDSQRRTQWDELFICRDDVETIVDKGLEHHIFIGHIKYKSPNRLLVSPRDFATICALDFDRNTGEATYFTKSIDCGGIPPERPFVRAHLYPTGYVIEPYGPHSKVTYIIQIDPKGLIPRFVVNFVSKQQPLTLATLRDYVMKSRSTPYPLQ